MKKILNLILMLTAVALWAGCGFVSKETYEKDMKHQGDSLFRVVVERENAIRELSGELNEVSDMLDKVNGQIAIHQDDENLLTQRERLLQKLETVRQRMAQKQKEVDNLQKKYNAEVKKNDELNKFIKSMQQDIAGYQARLAKYEGMLSDKTAQIEELSTTLAETQETLEQTSAAVEQQAEVIDAQVQELNRAYYIVGTKAQLKELGLIEGGIFNKKRLTTKGFDTSAFTQVDLRELEELQLDSKDATVLTSMPEASYEMEKSVDKKIVLRITDKKLFWSNSKFLVIMI